MRTPLLCRTRTACSHALALLGLSTLGLMPQIARAQTIGTIPPTYTAQLPAAIESTSPDFETQPFVEPKAAPFLPTMDRERYMTIKAAANVLRGWKPQDDPGAVTDAYTPPVSGGVAINGLNQSQTGGWYPPDAAGACGPGFYVQVHNSQLAMYKTTSTSATQVKSVSLNSFFKYSNQALFDPRVIYDHTKSRWVITSDAFQETGTLQLFFVGVSKTSDPTGAWYLYSMNITHNAGDFFDYPMLGQDSKSILVTANVFGQTTFRGASLLVFDKGKLYSGAGATMKMWTGLNATLTPPYVRLGSGFTGNTWLIANQAFTSGISLYKLTYPSGVPTLSAPTTVPVGYYGVPRNANQPGTSDQLDTLDTRFQQNTTQVNDTVYAIHTIDNNGFPAARYYQIDAKNRVLVKSGIFSASSTSDDWNPSITTNSSGASADVFVCWSSTDTANGINAQVRFSGLKSADTFTAATAQGTAVYTSSIYSTEGRWGDYSSITVDPSNGKVAWGINQINLNPSTWGTEIFRIQFP